MKTSILFKSALVASFLFFTAATFALNVPKPMAIDIDDLGWKEGWDLHESGGPYRLGLPQGRTMTLQDYEVIVYLSKAVGVRLKSLFIMSEFDRSNICARCPTTNEKGSNWDNSALVSDSDFAVMNYVKENAAHIEFGLHGVRHEFWSASVNGRDIACYYEERGFAYVVLPKLDKKQYTLTVTTGPSDMPTYVWNDGTYNVQDFQSGTDNAVVGLEMYGTQRVKVKLRFEPREVTSSNTGLEIKEWHYEAPFLSMLIHGRNIQGQPGVITIRGKPLREQE